MRKLGTVIFNNLPKIAELRKDRVKICTEQLQFFCPTSNPFLQMTTPWFSFGEPLPSYIWSCGSFGADDLVLGSRTEEMTETWPFIVFQPPGCGDWFR